MDLLAPSVPRYGSNRLPHRTGPRDTAAAAGAASLAGTIGLLSVLTQSSTTTPDPAPAARTSPAPAA